MHWMSESQRKQLGMTEASTDMVWFVVSTWIPQNFHGDRLDHEAVAPQNAMVFIMICLWTCPQCKCAQSILWLYPKYIPTSNYIPTIPQLYIYNYIPTTFQLYPIISQLYPNYIPTICHYVPTISQLYSNYMPLCPNYFPLYPLLSYYIPLRSHWNPTKIPWYLYSWWYPDDIPVCQ